MMPFPAQRLIEAWMPLRRIGEASQREKSMRRGHLSTLHQWWSRKPLVASRAAVYASLMPGDTPHETLLGLCECLPEAEAVAAACQDLSQQETSLRLLDPFSGGGSIPLEALRLGCDIYANDLNPVAHILLHCTLHYPQRWRNTLADDVERWGQWVQDQVTTSLHDIYAIPHDASAVPNDDPESTSSDESDPKSRPEGAANPYADLTTSAYLWTRTVLCHNPACGGHMPLMRKSWLSRRAGRYIALKVTPDESTKRVRFALLHSKARTDKAAIAELGFDPGAFSKAGHTSCLFCGVAIPSSHVRAEGLAGRLGLQLMVIACTQNSRRGKRYIGATEPGAVQPLQAALEARIEQLCEETGLTRPDEPLPAPGSLGISVQNYGMTRWSDLYTTRQLLALLTYCKWVRAAYHECLRERRDAFPDEPEDDSATYAKAVATYLALGVTKVANRGSTLVIYNPHGEKLESPISNGRMAFNWDVAEVNPLGNASGNYIDNLKYTIEALRSLCFATSGQSHITQGPAQWLDLPDASIDVVITDPPYYDNVPYSSLADYFYIWLKRMLEPLYADALALPLTPKKRELVVDLHKHNGDKQSAHQAFEEGMGEALQELHRVLRDDGILVLIYAHKTTLGWSSLIDALRQAQFEVTEAWPLATERAARLRAQRAAALASSIFLTARKRSASQDKAGALTTDVLPLLKEIVAERVQSLFAQGIQGTDLVIACVGAGLRAFTRYPSVERPGGQPMTTIDYLQEVQREVVSQILSHVMGVQDDTIAHIDPLSQFYTIARFQFGEAPMPFDEGNILAKGLGLELTSTNPLLISRRAIAQKRGTRLLLRDYKERGPHCPEPTPEQLAHAPLIDLLHRLLWLLDEAPQQLPDRLEAWRPIVPRLRLLAQALAGRTFNESHPQSRPQRTHEEQQIDTLLAMPHFTSTAP